jgi:hypothetical protein
MFLKSAAERRPALLNATEPMPHIDMRSGVNRKKEYGE